MALFKFLGMVPKFKLLGLNRENSLFLNLSKKSQTENLRHFTNSV